MNGIPARPKGGRGDATWLADLADSFQLRAGKNLELRLKPREAYNLGLGLRRAANNLEVLEYESEMVSKF